MKTKEIENLLSEYRAIQEKIEVLLNESDTVVKKIVNAATFENEPSEKHKDILINDKLKKLDYHLTPKSINSSRHVLLTRNQITYITKIKNSKYHNHNMNAWYTEKAEVLKHLDFLFLLYPKSEDKYTLLILSQKDIKLLLNKIDPSQDGRVHLKIITNKDTTREIQSNLDLTNTENNFSLLL